MPTPASNPHPTVSSTPANIFRIQEGALYELHTAPGYITTIALEPGEQLVNYAVGDTARWVVGDVVKGDQTLLLVKPTKPKLSTNLVITTDRRIYLLEASSHKGATYNASIAWTYPLDSLSRQVAAIDAARTSAMPTRSLPACRSIS